MRQLSLFDELTAPEQKTTTSTRDYRRRAKVCMHCGGARMEGFKHCGTCLDAINKRYKEKQQKLQESGLCMYCKCESPNGRCCQECVVKRRKTMRDINDSIKKSVFEAYGGFHCVCCGETMKECLSIDHINGGGNQHRKSVVGNRGGPAFYRWLKQNKFPPGFRVLCMNCQFGRKHNSGVCPHEVARNKDQMADNNRLC